MSIGVYAQEGTSGITLTIRGEVSDFEVWLEVKGTLTILDESAADLIEEILRVRRPGTYHFEPMDMNG